MEVLRGKRTYILAALGILVVVLNHFGVMTELTTETILKALGFGGLMALRAGVAAKK